MKEHPILFSGPMVRAILDGRKTQTRRVVKPQPTRKYPWYGCETGMQFWTDDSHQGEKGNPEYRSVPYGTIGDRLWVRETWRCEELESGQDGVRYRADNSFRPIENSVSAADAWVASSLQDKPKAWRTSIFMPRWASRLTLEIVNVWVERLQDISKDSAKAEGMGCSFHWSEEEGEYKFDIGPYDAYRANYRRLWDKLNGKTFPWESNPWVWVIDFRQLKEQQ